MSFKSPHRYSSTRDASTSVGEILDELHCVDLADAIEVQSYPSRKPFLKAWQPMEGSFSQRRSRHFPPNGIRGEI